PPRATAGPGPTASPARGTTAPSKRDTVTDTNVGGAFDGYTHAGPLRGGNVTFTMAPPTPTPPATPG
ncbi:MAG: hypothetical protein ACKOTZ_09550, partial [Chloroflexota bacterium]